jgi:hypothetical protein
MNRLEMMLADARKAVEAGAETVADAFYRAILRETTPPTSGLARVAHGEACVWNARKALANGRFGTAEDWYREAINADPRGVEYRIEFCIKCLIPLGLYKDARVEAQRATKIEPDLAAAWRTLGGLEHKVGNIEASIAAYDWQIELAPEDACARLDRATIALDTADYETVRAMCEPVLGTDRRADALHCLGMAEYREGRHERAIDYYDQAIGLGCYDTDLARWNRSLALHSIGRYREGWAEHEQRGSQKTDPAMAFIMHRFDAPMWQGEPPPARLHVHHEMGHGDAIAMARYAPILVERGYDVRLEVNDALVDLMRRSMPDVEVMAKAVDYPAAMGIPSFDYHIPMLSLPHLMATDIDTVPWQGAYLVADLDLVRQYDAGIPTTRAGFRVGRSRVGLCWSSGIRNDGIWLAEYGRRKSMALEAMRPIFSQNRENIFISLQAGPERKECHELIIELLPQNPTWDDTAAIIANLDLVITVDTAVAHLAGAMGKPTWLMMHTEGSWHFLAPRPGAPWNERSPWYPSIRIYRQDRPHEWSGVVERIARELSDGKVRAVA